MKLISFLSEAEVHLGFILGEEAFSVSDLNQDFPDDMLGLLSSEEGLLEKLPLAIDQFKCGQISLNPLKDFKLLAPIPNPPSCRDAYAFRQHVASARKNRGLEMIPEFDEYPVFYFTNHRSIQGPGDIECMEDHFKGLDFELEIAVVIGKKGRNIKARNASEYIAGYTIMNDMSARTLQMEEMLLNLGPAKGKDFSTVIGPCLVTPDELEPYRIEPKKGHTGLNYNLGMKAWVNQELVSEGNMSSMDWTFSELIERCSYGVDLYPGDVIGSGTVGTGCFLELNGTGKRLDPDYQPRWLKEGDTVKMEIEGLGTLENTIVRSALDWSILKLKKPRN